MKYAIIAAGEGSRLSQEGISAPKPLVEVGGEMLIDRLLRIFTDNEASEILVICNEQATEVNDHLINIEQNGINGRLIPLRHIVKGTPSSMHSFHELSRYLGNEPFIMTTVDTIFREKEFAEYVEFFKEKIAAGEADGVMGVTDYIDDEKPLYIKTDKNLCISAFLDKDNEKECRYISGGIYGLTQKAISTLQRCMNEGQSRMRNFQRGLIDDNQCLIAYPFSKILDIDHASDIAKAEDFIAAKHIVGVFRAQRFSPNSVENDRLILQLTLSELAQKGYRVSCITEEEVVRKGAITNADFYLCMARSGEALGIIGNERIINSAEGISLCNNRKALNETMQRIGIPCPQQEGDNGIWIKRGEGTAEQKDDTVFCTNEQEIEEAIRRFHARNIIDVVRQAHIVGDLIKFYGVAGTDLFHTLYPTDTGRSKFGCEVHNGQACHYAFDINKLKADANKLASHIGVPIYGGDAIIKEDGSYSIIDFNDWPTFSPCRELASKKIAEIAEKNVR